MQVCIFNQKVSKGRRERERERDRESVSLSVRSKAFANWGTITFVLINIACDTQLELFLSLIHI